MVTWMPSFASFLSRLLDEVPRVPELIEPVYDLLLLLLILAAVHPALGAHHDRWAQALQLREVPLDLREQQLFSFVVFVLKRQSDQRRRPARMFSGRWCHS
jgi:hypothetical protein